ncbi:MAG: 50S ribosomal protein L11 methyltransferase [Bdellovibrionaceae bacterium]|nr:50S ribosomal protein L11 methyltransferase [Pseudobdellovibrionaceae bacterium]
MSTEKYFEVHVNNLERHQEDFATGQLFSVGAAGVSEVLQFTQKDLQFEPEVVETESLNLVAYFESWNPQIFEQIQSFFPQAQVTLKEEAHKDWMEEWKKGFEPFVLAGETWIVPSWRKAPAEAQHVIYIDPGMAFGTGTHETTRVCSELIWEYCKTEKAKTRAVDIGTGTGILAMLMEQQGFQEIYCSDIDPECKRVTQENFVPNNIKKTHWRDQIDISVGEIDLLVANIIDGVLLNLKDYFLQLSNPKTQFILSGILEEHEQEFTERF